MSTFNLTIKLGNDAMQTPEDVAGALYDAAEALMNGVYPHDVVIFDENGNKVGEWNVA